MNKVATKLVMSGVLVHVQDYDRGQPNGVPELNTLGKISYTYFPDEQDTTGALEVSSENPTSFINYVLSLLQ